VRRRSAGHIAELGEDRGRDARADAVVAHQRLAAGLAASEALQLKIEIVQYAVEVLDDAQRDGDLLLGDRGQVQVGELLAGVLALQACKAPGLHRHAVVKEDGVDALQPLGALINQRLSQPHLRAQIKDVPGRDPRLRQALLHQQLAQQSRVELVSLRAPLAVPGASASRRARPTAPPRRHERIPRR